MSYQLTISGKGTSRPMVRKEAEALEALLQVIFPGLTILAIPLLCPECGCPVPDSGPCWHNRFEEETVTSEELEQALIPQEEERPTLAEMMEKEAQLRAKIETEWYGQPISPRGSK